MQESIEEDYKRIFQKYDTNGNNTIDRNELIDIITEAKGQRPTKKEIDKLLQKIDVNHDEKISYDEFRNAMKEMNSSRQKEIKECFDQFDQDKNGIIDKKELYDILKTTGEGVDIMQVDVLFELYDTNKDGKIDFNEYVHIYKDLGIF